VSREGRKEWAGRRKGEGLGSGRTTVVENF
jgi:hypothetical protein